MVDINTSGQSLVCKLWIGVSKGMLPVRHLAPKIHMAVNYCGSQLDRRLGWAAPASDKKEGAILVRTNIAISMAGGMMNAVGCGLRQRNSGSLSGKGREVSEELRKRMNDASCLQEAR